MAIEITARKREAQGTGPSRRLRNAGKVPGILCGGDQGPVNIELDHRDLAVGHSMHVRELALPKGIALALHKDENPVVATVIVPALITEEEEAAAAAEAVAPSEIPTTEQAAPPKEGEAPAEGEKAAPKAAEKPEKPEKPEKKEKK